MKNLKADQTDLFSDETNNVSPKNRIKELELIIETLDTLYEEGKECINPISNDVVLDNEYDLLKNELYNLCPNSRIFDNVTSSKAKMDENKVVHNPPMTSINKCNGTEEEKEEILHKWIYDGMCSNSFPAVCSSDKSIALFLCKKVLKYPQRWFTMSYKHDGIALSIEYKNGKLFKAGLRSKSGVDGTDVTDKMKYIKNVPEILQIPITCILRGELETPISVFNKINPTLDDPKSNPRAYTSGAMGQKYAEEIKGRGIQFVCYNIIMDNPPYETEMARYKWAKETLNLNFVETMIFDIQKLKEMEKNHKNLDFMVDGVVISVNRLSNQKELGTSGSRKTGNPKGKLAYKFADEVKYAVVKEIQWQTGRTGTVTPVLIFDGIQLEGTTVSRCTAHNWGIIKSKKIGIGSKIEIIKSGKIIPKLKSVISSAGKVEFPNNCPSCGGKVKETEGNNDALSLVCLSLVCPAQKIKRFNHYLNTIGAKGVAESTLTKLADSGLITDLSDLYRLTPSILEREGFTERTSALIYSRIKMFPNPEEIKDSKELLKKVNNFSSPKMIIPLETFIASFGMDGAGREVGKILTEAYGDFEIIRNLSPNELETVEGIGPITASSINFYFKENKNEIDKLLQFVTPIVIKKNGKLNNKNFVLSGSLDGGKKKWEILIKDNGGTVKGSVGRGVDYLIAGDGSGSKSEKAKELGISIISTFDLEKMV